MLDINFFQRAADKVAKELLGKILVRKFPDRELRARIVETEAYFDEKDPASRACQNGDLRETMMMKAGTILVYGVHNNWLINFVTGEKGKAEAVLIRAVEPLNFFGKCNGPGLLTKILKINKKFHKNNIFNDNNIWIEDFDENNNSSLHWIRGGENVSMVKYMEDNLKSNVNEFNNKNLEIVESFRIGVKRDLNKKLRFYIKDNEYVSK